MKRYLVGLLAIPLFFGCNNAEKQQIKDLSAKDSALLYRTQSQDSSIISYIKSFNDIEQNLDSIKLKAKMLSVSNGEVVPQKDQVIADIRSIGELMLRNKKEIAALQRKLKQSSGKNEELQKMIARLSQEINEKDAQIAALQSQLAETNVSLKDVIQKFNDSMQVVYKQKEQINTLTNDMNTVYYAVGTMKELKKKRVVSKTR